MTQRVSSLSSSNPYPSFSMLHSLILMPIRSNRSYDLLRSICTHIRVMFLKTNTNTSTASDSVNEVASNVEVIEVDNEVNVILDSAIDEVA